jgi:hypothetical protein
LPGQNYFLLKNSVISYMSSECIFIKALGHCFWAKFGQAALINQI